jgi:hypothetical protein
MNDDEFDVAKAKRLDQLFFIHIVARRVEGKKFAFEVAHQTRNLTSSSKCITTSTSPRI